jgi:hypothetical protein
MVMMWSLELRRSSLEFPTAGNARRASSWRSYDAQLEASLQRLHLTLPPKSRVLRRASVRVCRCYHTSNITHVLILYRSCADTETTTPMRMSPRKIQLCCCTPVMEICYTRLSSYPVHRGHFVCKINLLLGPSTALLVGLLRNSHIEPFPTSDLSPACIFRRQVLQGKCCFSIRLVEAF